MRHCRECPVWRIATEDISSATGPASWATAERFSSENTRIGESVTGERWELQLKGAGLTPYSRFADGRAIVRSSVREFLCSEAMHHLGVPTSRAGTLVVSPETVIRDPHYDGHPRHERTAVLLRLAPCWFRFGSLQMLAADGREDSLSLLADFIAEKFYPRAAEMTGGERYSALAREIAVRTASLMAKWESVGFTHGVMNTDNMSVLGTTIDYGPFGFMDRYDPQFVPNSSDANGVYRYAHQPRVAQWNICRLWESLMPIMPAELHDDIKPVLEAFVDEYLAERRRLFAAKLGLSPTESTAKLTSELVAMMEATAADFTMTFRQLGEATLDRLTEIANSVQAELSKQESQRETSTTLDSTESDHQSARTSTHPHSTIPWALQTLASSPTFSDWLLAYRTELSAQDVSDHRRQTLMCAANARYILRQWMAHRAAEAAEVGRYEEAGRLLRVLQRPFTRQQEAEEGGYADLPPSWSCSLSLSCSS